MTIDWTTVLFEAINFVVLVLIAVRFVYRPVRRILDQRQAEIIARAQETEQREAEASAARARFEGELATIDELAERRVREALTEARTAAERILDEARASARAELDKAEAELGVARRRALERFRGEILRLGTEAAQRIVRELGSSDVGLGFARRAAHALEDAVGGRVRGPVDVQHSPDIDPDALADLLRVHLGPQIELRLRVDEALIAGVRLHSQGFEIEASAGASLDDWYHSLARAA
ncbi:MAG TPA: ATP synthase F0 subunit B [Enhygromyxa sp.]|nr:ATP synthase F0 subunit B [Enhygromyxa sp.]